MESQFFKGDEVTEIRQEVEEYILQLGFSRGLDDNLVKRWRIGYRYRSDEFSPGDELPPPDPFPWDREMSFPFVSFDVLQDNYTTAFNLDQIHRTEDLHLGYRFYNLLGYAATGFGSDSDRVVIEGLFSDTLIYNGNELWRHRLEWQGILNLDTDRSEDVTVAWETRYFRRQTSHRSFFASLQAVWSHNLNTHQQIVLGGLTGARGFENRFQAGDRRWSVTLEERMYTDVHLWNLLRLGWALFIDAGRAWEPGVGDGLEDATLINAGFGIRLASSKAEAGRIAHIDFAFPLSNKDDPQVDSYLIAVNIKNAF
ncbi:MAG: BamA/TamA family outer membrane protein [Pseudomonadales bacterium]|nr:BamA/TamA family outer membrane protein [Pseudomonadales bacterium]